MTDHIHSVPSANWPAFGSRKGVPGQVVVEVAVFREGDAEYDPKGSSLATLREVLGGNEGFITEPFRGDRVRVSLLPWAHLDFDKARFELRFSFKPDLPIAPEHRHLFPGLQGK